MAIAAKIKILYFFTVVLMVGYFHLFFYVFSKQNKYSNVLVAE